jgi:hypothetical protein
MDLYELKNVDRCAAARFRPNGETSRHSGKQDSLGDHEN